MSRRLATTLLALLLPVATAQTPTIPYPFGHEITGYQVPDLAATLEKAKSAGVKLLSAPYKAGDRTIAIVQFPGAYIAELHSLSAR
jgi:hypothetical protein